LTGASKNTVISWMMMAGKACAAYHDEHVRSLTTKRVQVDEIWSFTYAKQKTCCEAKAAPSQCRRHLDLGPRLLPTTKLNESLGWSVAAMRDYAIAFMDDCALG